jgi:hypothetical protein
LLLDMFGAGGDGVSCREVKHKRIIFAWFAVAILFSIVHEWSLPIACLRPVLARDSGITQNYAR